MLLVVLVMVVAGGYAMHSGLDFFQDISGADASEEKSLYRSANLEPALAALREEVGPRTRVDLKIEQRSLKATASVRGRGDLLVVVTADGDVVDTSTGAGAEDAPRLQAVSAEAVEKIADAVVRRADIALEDIAYLSMDTSKRPDWNVYVDGGGLWEAGLDGTDVRRSQ